MKMAQILPLSYSSIVLLIMLFVQTAFAREDHSHLIPLHFLNILPFPSDQPNAGWDRGYELLPAAQLAMDHVNNAADILPGYQLHVVTVPSEPCGIRLITDGLVNSYVKVYKSATPLNVVGVGGLFCSTVTNALAEIFSSPNVTFLQLVASTTPVHRYSSDYSWLVHFISSSHVFNSALFAMMRTYSWQKIGLIYSSSNTFFTLEALDFIEHTSEFEVEIVSLIPLSDNQDKVNIFQSNEARIVYIAASNSESAVVMCEAYKSRALYPGYVYILPDKSAAGIVAQTDATECTATELREAMEGVFFVDYNLAANDDEILISNMTYSEYHQEYISQVKHVESVMNITLDKNNVYANIMYDQVWALVLALKASLGKISAQNVNLGDINLLDYSIIAETLRSEIRTVSFQGASGYISFNMNNERDTLVSIFQVVGGKEELVAEYQSENNEKQCMGNNTDLNTTLCVLKNINPPPDTFKTTARLLPTFVFALTTIALTFLIITTTTSFILLYVIFRNRPEVKATSITLSIVMNIGCYFGYLSAVLRTVNKSYAINNSVTFSTICSFETWLEIIGITVVFSALLMRLLRVRQIFKAYGRVSRFWNDKYLVSCVLFICLGVIIILSVWTGIDPYRKITIQTYKPFSTPPHLESFSFCFTDYYGVRIALTSSYNGALMLLVIVVAIQTRKVKLSNFKDTKKINIFIAATCTTLAVLFPLFFIVGIELNNFVGSFFISIAIILCTGVYCQVFLFLPLVVKVLRNIRAERTIQKSLSSIELIQKKERQYS